MRDRCWCLTANSIRRVSALIKDSFIEMGILDKKPSDDDILTRRFLPVKP